MTPQQLKDIISQGDKVNVEFKLSKNKLSGSVFDTVVSFLNTKGGHIILGVDDNKKIVGVDELKAFEIKKDFSSNINNSNKLFPYFPIMLNDIYIDGKLVLYVYVPRSSFVHKLNNKTIFIRSNEGDMDVTNNPLYLNRLYFSKSNISFENTVYPDLRIDDFDTNTIDKF